MEVIPGLEGLSKSQRKKLIKKEKWEKVLNGLAPLPVENGLYVLHEGVQDMWTKFNFEQFSPLSFIYIYKLVVWENGKKIKFNTSAS